VSPHPPPLDPEYQMTGRPRVRDRLLAWAGILAIVVAILIGINGILYANKVGRNAERVSSAANARTEQEVHNFCTLLSLLDNAYTSNPPSTTTGKSVASAVHALRASLKC